MKFFLVRRFLLLAGASGLCHASAQQNVPLVDIRSVDPSIVIDLRYAGSNNIAGHPLYPKGTAPRTRPDVAQRLSSAQNFLRRYGYGLAIWDAYRPRTVQLELWKASHNNDYVADPNAGAGSLHTWGLAVDATLVDNDHHSVSMPTDFDDFTPAAMWKYQGTNPAIRAHLYILQVAMRNAGFYGMRSEWWHFTINNWQTLLPPEEARRALQAMGRNPEGKL